MQLRKDVTRVPPILKELVAQPADIETFQVNELQWAHCLKPCEVDHVDLFWLAIGVSEELCLEEDDLVRGGLAQLAMLAKAVPTVPTWRFPPTMPTLLRNVRVPEGFNPFLDANVHAEGSVDVLVEIQLQVRLR